MSQGKINQVFLEKLEKIEAISNHQKKFPKESPINTQNILTCLLAVAGFFGLTIYNNVQQNTISINTISSNQKHIVSVLDDLKEFMKDPRFTKPLAIELVDKKLDPVKLQVNQFSEKLKNRGQWMQDVNKNINNMLRDIHDLQEDLSTLEKHNHR